MERELINLLEQKRKQVYRDPNSIMKEYGAFLEANSVYHSISSEILRKQLKGRLELADGIIRIYQRAKLSNERISLLEDLLAVGYDKNRLVALIIEAFYCDERPVNLWEYSNLLYTIKDFSFLNRYIEIVKDESYGEARQMIVLLIGKSKKETVVPVLVRLLEDKTVYGHALDALCNFSGDEITQCMLRYSKCKVKWIREIAKKYLAKIEK